MKSNHCSIYGHERAPKTRRYPITPRSILGIDFSGARDAGKKIWISAGTEEGGRLRVTECFRAADLAGSSRNRETCLKALVGWIESEGASAVGLDFPFGIPVELMGGTTWEDFVLAFPSRFTTADHFRQFCREKAHGKEFKRQTDREAQTPFSPYNLRLYRQTCFGIRNVLHPLVAHASARVLPMQAPLPGRTSVLEICPASTLKREGLYYPYKGKGADKQDARSRILDDLVARGLLEAPPKTVLTCVLEDTEGDALDSVLAAIAVVKALANPYFEAINKGSIYLKEGYVY